MDQALLTEVFTRLADGFVTTLEIFALTLLISLPLGLIMSFGSMSKFLPLKYAVRFLVWVVRGSPLMIQLILVFYGPGLLGQWALDLVANGNTNAVIIWLSNIGVMERFVAVIIAFSVNYACYFSEIYRGGIESIPKGQYEAGQVLGMTKTQVFFKVVLMQVVKRIIPPMSNEIITLVKDTSLARVIAVYELIWAGETFIKLKGIIWPLIATAIFYLAFSGLLTFVFGKIEKKLDYYKT
ncbi:MAG: amino acid ABC transporter permease [Clostridia bacterium]|nr:amino acid ABC transporter permease [Clostridia bacterium]